MSDLETRLRAVEGQLDAAVKALRVVEWVYDSEFACLYCPACQSESPDVGHDRGCEIATVLASVSAADTESGNAEETA